MKRADTLHAQLEDLALAEGVDYFGVADLTPASESVEAQGGPIVAKYPRAVSIGMQLFDDLVEMVTPKTRFEVSPYIHHIYNVVSPHLDVISLKLAQLIRKNGFKALPVPHLLSGKNTAIFSYKLAAHLAGHGWIGKNCLLVTPDHGPRVRFSAVLTDAPLPAGQPITEHCGGCTICVDACPVRAFTGRAFRPDEPRAARFDAEKCERFRGTDKKIGDPEAKDRTIFACGVCVQVCPFGNAQQLPGVAVE
jgi:epoxyqueuosine reductase